VSLAALLVYLAILPLLLTKTRSLGEADSACLEAAEYLDEIKSSSSTHLSPSHEFNIASAVFSLFCFLMWVFATPHTSSSESRLDLRRMTFSSSSSSPPPPPTTPHPQL
jgi:hypothetical protein